MEYLIDEFQIYPVTFEFDKITMNTKHNEMLGSVFLIFRVSSFRVIASLKFKILSSRAYTTEISLGDPLCIERRAYVETIAKPYPRRWNDCELVAVWKNAPILCTSERATIDSPTMRTEIVYLLPSLNSLLL